MLRLLLTALFLVSCLPAPPPSDMDGDGYEYWIDCNEHNNAVHPGATEFCDGVDNNCDDDVDEDAAANAPTWYLDTDGDGYGDTSRVSRACQAPTGYVSDSTDCDDTDPAYNPGAEESDCTDLNDYNCDGFTGYIDSDGDGFAACEECDDGDASVYPGATDAYCRDGVDNDCDGVDDGTIAFGDLRFGDLVMTEIMIDPVASPQWFEIYNLSECEIEVEPFYLRNSYGEEEQLIDDCSAKIDSGDHLTFSTEDEEEFDCTFDPAITTLENNNSLEITTNSGNFLESIFWNESLAGHSWSLDPGAYDPATNNDLGNWCWESEAAYNSDDFGTPGTDNSACP
ncbi:MAG: hypothetical protein UX09_C0002G0008 [Candidatus Uhrbacteria bacterium GW2011_GWE2_45_35]|uniref:LTD domain-containing protein n=2 Tax=Candidatus Uhriibacteriota TaxID=1752732 RepID=A0A0G1JK53_9BACT|nr:MAG: hypothetical protein UW63_C0004G0017 [Candidatus Uhrbacteria bacterium GW2011_GWF2_44_350]KKU09165.1 MAG: hypothetical protein UX09_C0002G0008 [Candidatus Uhrbacteria bacterium GW2011_GWE2_45_35]